MAELTYIVLGPILVAVGWLFYRNPQTGFRIHNWPFVSSDDDSLTDDGEFTYRARGITIMLLGLLLLIAGFAL